MCITSELDFTAEETFTAVILPLRLLNECTDLLLHNTLDRADVKLNISTVCHAVRYRERFVLTLQAVGLDSTGDSHLWRLL